MHLIKKIILVYTFVALSGIAFLTFSFLNVSDYSLLNKAISQETTKDQRITILQRWLAEKKLKYLGFNQKCIIGLPSQNKRLTLLFLVEMYGEKSINNDVVLGLISSLINHGCNVNSYDAETKITAFHSAIMLADDTSLVNFLLQNGANIETPIQRKKAKGKNAIEWAELLLSIRDNKKLPTRTIKKIIFLLEEHQQKIKA